MDAEPRALRYEATLADPEPLLGADFATRDDSGLPLAYQRWLALQQPRGQPLWAGRPPELTATPDLSAAETFATGRAAAAPAAETKPVLWNSSRRETA
jgi:hypothetical protein